jgi:polyisoprenoid-binding protein YceI
MVRGIVAFAALVSASAARGSDGAAVFVVDPKASYVRVHLGRSGLFGFMGHEHHIEAPIAEGRVEVVNDEPSSSSVALRFATSALHVVPGTEPAKDIPEVERRMRGPEVLDVSRHCEASFRSTSVRSSAARDHGHGAPGTTRLALVVAGELTLKGRAFPVEVPLEVVRDGAALRARGEVELKLRALGIEPPSVGGVVNVKDRFKLEFEIHAGDGSGPLADEGRTPPLQAGGSRRRTAAPSRSAASPGRNAIVQHRK